MTSYNFTAAFYSRNVCGRKLNINNINTVFLPNRFVIATKKSTHPL